MKGFDENIIALIDMLEYDMWLIAPDKHIDCVCKSFETKQADKHCQKCFGIGYKIKIRKIKGVRQPTQISTSELKVTTETGVYFFKKDYGIKEDDIIVWGNEIEQVTRTDRFCSDSRTPVYFRCDTKPKKSNYNIFLKNLSKVINRTIRRR